MRVGDRPHVRAWRVQQARRKSALASPIIGWEPGGARRNPGAAALGRAARTFALAAQKPDP